MHRNIEIRIIDKSYNLDWGFPSYVGEITLGSFQEKFVLPISFWKKQDYETQWIEGLKRLQYEDKSCLITSITGSKEYLDCALNVTWWVMYKEKNKIIVRNQWLSHESYKNIVRGPFNAQTCYYFIPPKEYSRKIKCSEWLIDLDKPTKRI